jgi:hypothetical protein
MDYIIMIIESLLLLATGILLGWKITFLKARDMASAIGALLDQYGPGTINDKIYFRLHIVLAKWFGSRPKCWKCKYLTEWNCNQPLGAIDGEGCCTGWARQLDALSFLRGIIALKKKGRDK